MYALGSLALLPVHYHYYSQHNGLVLQKDQPVRNCLWRETETQIQLDVKYYNFIIECGFYKYLAGF